MNKKIYCVMDSLFTGEVFSYVNFFLLVSMSLIQIYLALLLVNVLGKVYQNSAVVNNKYRFVNANVHYFQMNCMH